MLTPEEKLLDDPYEIIRRRREAEKPIDEANTRPDAVNLNWFRKAITLLKRVEDLLLDARCNHEKVQKVKK